jgi:enamine deaminase RidA (YjgF/YER057c/UK114 family)
MSRINISSSAPWEDLVGYSRAVRVGNTVEITGTVAVNDDGKVVGENDPYTQTRFILQKIEKILHQAGATLNNVVRTRMFVTDISRWEEFGRAHEEFFRTIRPCTSMIEIRRLIAPEYLIEIEATAIIE